MLRLIASIALAGALSAPALAKDGAATSEISAQRRARITVTPGYRYLPVNAKRECTSWLEREFRPSGTVVVPRMRCWWR